MDPMAVIAERTVRVLGLAVMAGWCGPNGGDGGGGGREGGDVVLTVEEEQDGASFRHNNGGWADGAVPRHGDGVEAIGVAAASKRAWEILTA
jgi:hypothetical protein